MFLEKTVRRFRLVLPAGLLVLGFARAAPAEEDAATKEARLHHDKGIAELQAEQPDYAEAYREFKTAYAVSPKWQILGSLGIACLHLERDGEAIEAFEKFLVEGGSQVPAEIVEQTEKDLAMLRATLVRVSITVDKSGASLVDERLDGATPIVNRYEPLADTAVIGVRAGKHRMTVTLPGYEPAAWEFEGAPKAELSHSFELRAEGAARPSASRRAQSAPTEIVPPDQGDRSRSRTSPALVVAAIGTGALLAAGTTTGILVLSAEDRFDSRNDGQRVDDAMSLRDNGQQLALVTDVLLGATVLAAAGTAYLYFSDRKASRRSERRAGRAVVTPAFGTRGAWIGLRGSF